MVLALLLILAQISSDSLPADSASTGPQLIENGPVRVEWQLIKKPRVLNVGDHIRLRLRVYHPRELTVSPPLPAVPNEVVVLDQKHHIQYRGDTAVDVYDLTLAVFVIGERKLAPFLVSYQQQNRMYLAASDSVPLRVQSLISERMQDINDLKPQVTFPNLLPLWIALGLIGAGLAGYSGWRFWQRYRRRQEELEPELPPWDEALQALSKLPVEEWLSAGQVKRLYYTVSEIVKRYLTRRFEFPAVDQTSTEIVRELKSRKVAVSERFATFFLDADLVKYAKYLPAEPASVVNRARELVELTRPAPEPASPAVEAIK
ncbi:MAG: tetratricopeptide repeat protein [candidate division WOR-3 bacterium]|nr:tetratricopeptide repeat protein [candidate division WOR-3 bacterium]